MFAALPIFAGLASALLWVSAEEALETAIVLPLEIAYGALVPAAVTPLAVRAVLGETGERG